ncbi:MAG: hypothetical protein QMC13_05385 [Colwellia sp.]|jgi:hypothetical protein
MNELPITSTLKEITAYKKKLNWGDVPAIYTMASSSISDIDGIMTHGFDSAYKRLFNKSNWNFALLDGFHDENGNVIAKHKPKIALRHHYDEQNYELHCFPIVKGEQVNIPLAQHPFCSFQQWSPESMQMLFRINSLISFIVFTFKSGDPADIALIKYAHKRVQELISELGKSFDIVEVMGYSIAEFCKELYSSKPNFTIADLLNNTDPNME